MRTAFEIAFDHYDSCPTCDYAKRKLCPEGRVLFDAAHDAATKLAGIDLVTPKARA